MSIIVNSDNKRVCDISADRKTIEIKKKDCVTQITANSDGTLNVIQKRTAITA